MADEWESEPTRPRMLTRLLVPESGTRPGAWAVAATLGGLAAFIASLQLDWVIVRIDSRQVDELITSSGPGVSTEFAVSSGVAGGQQLGTAYVIGTLGLILLLGLILGDAAAVRRLRLGALALGVGMLGVVAGMVHELANSTGGLASSTLVFGLDSRYAEAIQRAAEVALGPGMFVGVGAVVLLLVGVVFAGSGARLAVAGGAGPRDEADPDDEPEDLAGAHASGAVASSVVGPAAHLRQPVGRVGELSVSGSDAIDLGVGDVLGSQRRPLER